MRSILVSLFYLWFAGSVVALGHRRVTTGSFRPRKSRPDPHDSSGAVTAAGPSATFGSAPERPRSASLADALSGITMPCELTPLVMDRFDPHYVAFSTSGYAPATVGPAIADELESLGFELTPLDERSIHAARGADNVDLQIRSAVLDSEAVIIEKFPTAPEGALVVELRLR